MSGPILDGAPRWVTATKDGHLPAWVTRWLAVPPVVVTFTNTTTVSATHTFGRMPDVTLVRADGVVFDATVSVSITSAAATFSEPLTGKMILA